MRDAQFYLPDFVYDELVAALLRAGDDLADPETAVQTALGEVGRVWPKSIESEAEARENDDLISRLEADVNSPENNALFASIEADLNSAETMAMLET